MPRIEDKNSNMRMLKITTMDDLVPNSMNILEPSPLDEKGMQREDGKFLLSFSFLYYYFVLGWGGGVVFWNFVFHVYNFHLILIELNCFIHCSLFQLCLQQIQLTYSFCLVKKKFQIHLYAYYYLFSTSLFS